MTAVFFTASGQDAQNMGVDKNSYIPLYCQIKDHLKRRIIDGELNPGDPLPSRNKLLKEFETTRLTVDHAISELVKEGLVFAKKGSGTYVADRRSPSSGLFRKFGVTATKTLTSVNPPEGHYYFFDIFKGVLEAAISNHLYPVLISKEKFQRAVKENFLDFARENEWIGVISIGYNGKYDKRAAKALIPNSIPYVLQTHQPIKFNGHVITDDVENGVTDSIGRLVELGHSVIACLSEFSSDKLPLEPRTMGFLKAWKKFDLDQRDDLLVSDVKTDGIPAAVDQLLSSRPRPTAIYASNDILATTLLKELKKRKIIVPAEMSVIGVGDAETSAETTPPLTTLRVPHYERGFESVMLMLETIKKQSFEPVVRELKTQLIERGSSGRAPTTRP